MLDLDIWTPAPREPASRKPRQKNTSLRYGVIKYATGRGAAQFDGWYVEKADALSVYEAWREPGCVVALVERLDGERAQKRLLAQAVTAARHAAVKRLVLRLARQGKTNVEIAACFPGMFKERVSQIVRKHEERTGEIIARKTARRGEGGKPGSKIDPTDCDLDLLRVDEVDEVSGDEQLSLVWCRTHRTYEWRWLPKQGLPG